MVSRDSEHRELAIPIQRNHSEQKDVLFLFNRLQEVRNKNSKRLGAKRYLSQQKDKPDKTVCPPGLELAPTAYKGDVLSVMPSNKNLVLFVSNGEEKND